jgi:resuscitation-promoting factor RpfB
VPVLGSPVPGDSEDWSIVPRFLTGRTGRIAAQAAVLTAVVGGVVAYTHTGSKHVVLLVDDIGQQVDAQADTVGALLSQRGITPGPRDLVAPDPASPIVDGQTVVVRIARPFTVAVDGRSTTYWTTALTVDDALAAIGMRTQGALLSASRSAPLGRDGLSLDVVTPKHVSVTADGRTRALTTTSRTVGDLLGELGITVRPLDRLSAVPASTVTNGLTVALTRIDHRRVTATEALTFGTTRTTDTALYQGSTRVVTPGRAGSRSTVYDLVLADGKVIGRTLVSASVVSQPVQQVLAVGTKAKPVTTTTTSGGGGGSVAGADGLNWPALAKCESGGNPRAVNPSGYYGLYQFSLSTWRSVGGSGNPIDASPAEQLYRAKVLYTKAGAGQWSCGHWLFT